MDLEFFSSKGKDVCVGRKVVASQFLGVGLLWKVSGLSKRLLSLREDATVSGLGSLSFDTVSEREEMWKLIDNVFRVQRERERSSSPSSSPLKKTADFSVLWLTLCGRYPFLFRRMKVNYPSTEAEKFLEGRDLDSSARVPLEGEDLWRLPKERLSSMLEEGKLRGPNVWVKSWRYGWKRCDRTTPLLVAFLAAGNLDCAEVLLDASWRVDVCEWFEDPLQKEGRSPLHALLEWLIESRKGWDGGVAKRQKGLCLLRRLAKASQEAGCLGWELRVGGSNRKTTTALGLACILGYAEAVKALKEEGATARHQAAEFLFMAVNGWEEYLRGGLTVTLAPSLAPSASQIVEVIKMLEWLDMVSGGDVNKGRRVDKHSPLSLAVSRKSPVALPIAEALLNLGAFCVPTRCPDESNRQAPSQQSDSPPGE